MAVPSYGGIQMFGVAWKGTNDPNERASQTNAYAGLSGQEHLDLGARGRTGSISGILTGSTFANWKAAKYLLESYNDGVPRVYSDTAGDTWQNVLLKAPKVERYRPNAGNGFWSPFTVTLEHLSAT